jgi:hypothetical protein
MIIIIVIDHHIQEEYLTHQAEYEIREGRSEKMRIAM